MSTKIKLIVEYPDEVLTTEKIKSEWDLTWVEEFDMFCDVLLEHGYVFNKQRVMGAILEVVDDF